MESGEEEEEDEEEEEEEKKARQKHKGPLIFSKLRTLIRQINCSFSQAEPEMSFKQANQELSPTSDTST